MFDASFEIFFLSIWYPSLYLLVCFAFRFVGKNLLYFARKKLKAIRPTFFWIFFGLTIGVVSGAFAFERSLADVYKAPSPIPFSWLAFPATRLREPILVILYSLGFPGSPTTDALSYFFQESIGCAGLGVFFAIWDGIAARIGAATRSKVGDEKSSIRSNNCVFGCCVLLSAPIVLGVVLLALGGVEEAFTGPRIGNSAELIGVWTEKYPGVSSAPLRLELKEDGTAVGTASFVDSYSQDSELNGVWTLSTSRKGEIAICWKTPEGKTLETQSLEVRTQFDPPRIALPCVDEDCGDEYKLFRTPTAE